MICPAILLAIQKKTQNPLKKDLQSEKWRWVCLWTRWFGFPYRIRGQTKMGWSSSHSSPLGERPRSLSRGRSTYWWFKRRERKECKLVNFRGLHLLPCPRLKTMATPNLSSSSVWQMCVLFIFPFLLITISFNHLLVSENTLGNRKF